MAMATRKCEWAAKVGWEVGWETARDLLSVPKPRAAANDETVENPAFRKI